MPTANASTDTLLQVVRTDPEVRRAVLIDPEHSGASDERIAVESNWAIGFNLALVLAVLSAQAIFLFWFGPIMQDSLVPPWQQRIANLGPLGLQFIAGLSLWNVATGLAQRRERRIARKFIDALAPEFDRGGLALRRLTRR